MLKRSLPTTLAALCLVATSCTMKLRTHLEAGNSDSEPTGQTRATQADEPTHQAGRDGAPRATSGENDTQSSPKKSATTPKSTLHVWLIDHQKSLKSKEMERTDDVIKLWNQLDRSLLVHTTANVRASRYCAHPFLDQGVCESFDEPKKPAAPWQTDIPEHDARIGWQSEFDKTSLGSGIIDGSLKPLAPNTPGFIRWGITGTESLGEKRPVYFFALDGGHYLLPLDHLALGPGDVSKWPKDVQHSSYQLAVLVHGFSERDAPIDMPQELVAEVRAMEQKLSACSSSAWGPAEAEFRANDIANISATTRRNREFDIKGRYTELGAKRCKPQLDAVAKTFSKVLTHRRKQRERIYEAARKRFAN